MNTIKEPFARVSTATVRVLRSHDYCHFEVSLTAEFANEGSVNAIDGLRKTAARLADKAAEQYKIAKEHAALRHSVMQNAFYEESRNKAIEAKAETDRTPEEKAQLKEYQDRVYRANRNYDYEDDWDNQ